MIQPLNIMVYCWWYICLVDKMADLEWEMRVDGEEKKFNIYRLEKITRESFRDVSDNYKQKLVYNLLEAAKNYDQHNFFNRLLTALNKPDEEKYGGLLSELSELKKYAMPNEVFTDVAYAIILGIMSTYNNVEKGVENERKK